MKRGARRPDGRSAAGQALGSIAGSRGVSYGAELAGHAPLLVFDDVDLDQAVAGACFAAFLAAGQTCVSAKRIFVARSIYDEFASRLATRADALSVGDPFAPETDVGPLVSATALAAARRFVDASGAQILAGGSAPCAPSERRARPLLPADGARRQRGPAVLPGGVLRARRMYSSPTTRPTRSRSIPRRPTVLAGDPALDCAIDAMWSQNLARLLIASSSDDRRDAITAKPTRARWRAPKAARRW